MARRTFVPPPLRLRLLHKRPLVHSEERHFFRRNMLYRARRISPKHVFTHPPPISYPIPSDFNPFGQKSDGMIDMRVKLVRGICPKKRVFRTRNRRCRRFKRSSNPNRLCRRSSKRLSACSRSHFGAHHYRRRGCAYGDQCFPKSPSNPYRKNNYHYTRNGFRRSRRNGHYKNPAFRWFFCTESHAGLCYAFGAKWLRRR